MIKNGEGGANTTRNGLRFEKERDILSALGQKGFVVRERAIEYGGGVVAESIPKQKLYAFLKAKNVDYSSRIASKLLPDEALWVSSKARLHVIEKKFQTCSGSVDEKLQTCDFKLKQYKKLLEGIASEVTYSYVLSEWFKADRYRDVLAYIEECGCRYYFGEIPLEKLDLPEPRG